MELMAYTADTDTTPDFTAVLWRYMQSYRETPLSRKEMAAMLTRAGFKANENNVGQWLNGDRTPPPGLPYYSAIALALEEEDARVLAWSYTRSYKDNRKGAGRSGKHTVPPEPNVTKNNVSKIDQKKREWDERDAKKRQERDSHDAGDRTL